MGIKRIQYHATPNKESANAILKHRLRLPTKKLYVATHRYEIPTVSTADNPEAAAAYYPGGVIVQLKVRPGAKYLKRSMRSMKRSDGNLEGAVNRWIREAKAKGMAGIYVEGLQSTVGNQTLDPADLIPVKIHRDLSEAMTLAEARAILTENRAKKGKR